MARAKNKQKKNKRNKGGELEHETVLKTVGWGGWGEVGVLERAEGDSGLPYPEPEVPEGKVWDTYQRSHCIL